MSKILARVENIVVGDTVGSQGIDFEVWLYPVTSDSTIYNIMTGADYFQLSVDEGYTPLDYYDLIVSETIGYIDDIYGIPVLKSEIVVIGWNDFLTAGQSGIEYVDDFINVHEASGSLGRYGWLFAIGGSGAANGSVNHIGSSENNPGLLNISSGGADGNHWAQMRMAAGFHPYNMDSFRFVFLCEDGGGTQYTIGMRDDNAGSNGITSSTNAMEAYRAADDANWDINLRWSGISDFYPDVLPFATGNYFLFEGRVLSRSISGPDIVDVTFQYDLTNMDTGATASVGPVDAAWDTAYAVNPLFKVRRNANTARRLRADLFSIRLRGVNRIDRDFKGEV